MSGADEALPPIGAAQPHELEQAFGVFFQRVPSALRVESIANALKLLQCGELDPQAIFVVRRGGAVRAAMTCLPAAGASALLWPPQATPGADQTQLQDLLLQHATQWLERRGVKLAQALLEPEERSEAAALTRNGFVRVTQLRTLCHDLGRIAESRPGEPLVIEPYCIRTAPNFHHVLLRSYEGSLDCPEVNGVRTLEDILAGHRAQGVDDPERWWLALIAGRPVAVLLLAHRPDSPSWELTYLGVIPEARRRGFGGALTVRALQEANAAGASQLLVSVDRRNQPACRLYSSLGFLPLHRRDVYLATWSTESQAKGGAHRQVFHFLVRRGLRFP